MRSLILSDRRPLISNLWSPIKWSEITFIKWSTITYKWSQITYISDLRSLYKSDLRSLISDLILHTLLLISDLKISYLGYLTSYWRWLDILPYNSISKCILFWLNHTNSPNTDVHCSYELCCSCEQKSSLEHTPLSLLQSIRIDPISALDISSPKKVNLFTSPPISQSQLWLQR